MSFFNELQPIGGAVLLFLAILCGCLVYEKLKDSVDE